MPWWGWVLIAWPFAMLLAALVVAWTVRGRERQPAQGPRACASGGPAGQVRPCQVAVRDGAAGWACASVHLRGWQAEPPVPGARGQRVPDREPAGTER